MPDAPTTSKADPFDLWLRLRLKAEHNPTLDEELPCDLLRLMCDSRAEWTGMRKRWLAETEGPATQQTCDVGSKQAGGHDVAVSTRAR